MNTAAVLVWRISIGMDPWRIRRHLRCSTMQTALQLQVIFDEVIKIGMSVTVITAHSVLLVLHYKGIWCVSRVVDLGT